VQSSNDDAFSLGTDSRLLNFTDFNGNYTSFGAGITIAVVGDERKDLVAAFLAKGFRQAAVEYFLPGDSAKARA
jgi:hypothetical protein